MALTGNSAANIASMVAQANALGKTPAQAIARADRLAAMKAKRALFPSAESPVPGAVQVTAPTVNPIDVRGAVDAATGTVPASARSSAILSPSPAGMSLDEMGALQQQGRLGPALQRMLGTTPAPTPAPAQLAGQLGDFSGGGDALAAARQSAILNPSPAGMSLEEMSALQQSGRLTPALQRMLGTAGSTASTGGELAGTAVPAYTSPFAGASTSGLLNSTPAASAAAPVVEGAAAAAPVVEGAAAGAGAGAGAGAAETLAGAAGAGGGAGGIAGRFGPMFAEGGRFAEGTIGRGGLYAAGGYLAGKAVHGLWNDPNTSNDSALSGALTGAGVGAGIGSVVPLIGTGIGAGVGALAGGLIGKFGAKSTGPAAIASQLSQEHVRLSRSLDAAGITDPTYRDQVLGALEPMAYQAHSKGDVKTIAGQLASQIPQLASQLQATKLAQQQTQARNMAIQSMFGPVLQDALTSTRASGADAATQYARLADQVSAQDPIAAQLYRTRGSVLQNAGNNLAAQYAAQAAMAPYASQQTAADQIVSRTQLDQQRAIAAALAKQGLATGGQQQSTLNPLANVAG